MKTEQEIKDKLQELRKLYFNALDKYQQEHTTGNLLNIEQLYGRIRSLEWMLGLEQ